MSNPYSLKGKKAFVTGGKRRIGRGIALALAEAGCHVGINDLTLDQDGEETLRLVRACGREAEFFEGDISDASQVERMFALYLQRFGRIDILTNNPYGGIGQRFLDLTEENWDLNLDVGLKGFFLCSQQAALAMVAQGSGGCIVSTSSVHGRRAWKGDTAYGAAKAGVIRLTESMATLASTVFAAMRSCQGTWTPPTFWGQLLLTWVASMRNSTTPSPCVSRVRQKT